MSALPEHSKDSLAGARPSRDSFPPTQRGWLVAQLALGAKGRDRINAYVMTAYAEPLSNYFAGSSFRSMGAPADMVSGFFASRLAKERYFEQWIESGLPLRRWLINGFLFHLQEELRRRKASRAEPLGEFAGSEPAAATETAVEEFDRIWAASMVRSAATSARERCVEEGFLRHWEMFERHFVDGLTYAELADEFEVTNGQSASMVRTASIRFRQAVVDILLKDGATEEELDEEIARLMRALRRN
jgi:DNA-directed RNA polymerase specialized sigma24 family protein